MNVMTLGDGTVIEQDGQFIYVTYPYRKTADTYMAGSVPSLIACLRCEADIPGTEDDVADRDRTQRFLAHVGTHNARALPQVRDRRKVSSHLTSVEQRVVARLQAAKGECVSPFVLAKDALLYEGRPGPTERQTIRQHIANVRKKLPAGAIETTHGRGYRWTLTGSAVAA